ncbi:DUF4262 domain-containing protein [Mycobacterium shigaense]|uniref:DUF4262 domain-containing protein n=1 Tax=Mycobacterium shigaense TaxID=722731 RepID=UPI000E58B56C|nr:DUF4262 domain-containing protein [Mycobacterium shigaense]MEA1121420.1 DUF4262 domain-containing protein [Mycobacterium shigaense]
MTFYGALSRDHAEGGHDERGRARWRFKLYSLRAYAVLNSIAHSILEDNTVLAPAMHIDYQDRFLVEVVEVEHPDVHLKFAVGLFGPRVRALQLVWADDKGRWPWDAGWGHGRRRQPVLGVRTDLPGAAA